jgi:hypothetical protein
MKLKTSMIATSAAVLALVAAYGCVAPPKPTSGAAPNPPPPAPAAGGFLETFDSPAGFTNRFLTQVVHGVVPPDVSSWQGDHDDHCGAPTTSRTIHASNPAESFYWCGPSGPASGHIMTSMLTTGYAEVDFSPNQSFNHVTKVCWDQNQTDLGVRKWTQMVVVPEAVFQQNGGQLNYANPGEPVTQDNGHPISSDTFMFVMLRGSSQTYTGPGQYDSNFDGFTTADKARRFRNCITDLENGTLSIEMERESSTEVRTLKGSFPNGAARVIFQDNTYDAPKDPPPIAVPSPFTWHWDNIAVYT